MIVVSREETYWLNFSSNYKGSQDKPNAVLKISNPDSAIEFQDYSIKTFGTSPGSEIQVSLGNLSNGLGASGWVEFQTLREQRITVQVHIDEVVPTCLYSCLCLNFREYKLDFDYQFLLQFYTYDLALL